MVAVMAQVTVTAQYRQGVAATMAAVRALKTAMVAAVALVMAQCRLVKAPLGAVTLVAWAT